MFTAFFPASMTIFQFLADMMHVASFVFLIQRLVSSRSAAGISLKTQEMYLLVFMTRYLDVFSNNRYAYLVLMKLLYLALSGAIVYMMRKKHPWSTSYKNEADRDAFLHWKFAVAPCVVLAILVHHRGYWFEIFWAFSEYLEALAILPQLILVQRYGEVENLTANYVAALGAYRGLYVVNWVYKYSRLGYIEWIATISGIIQTPLYADFFYYYAISKYHGNKNVSLPK